MSVLQSRLCRTICLVALGSCLGVRADPPTTTAGQGEPAATPPPIIVAADQTPADFLDLVGQLTKARWRLLFRPPPPTPPTDRARAALILGSLLADSLLVWQAGDAQQFRNNNQEVLSYCRMLGLGEKLMPRLMAQGKMAESNEWKELRHEIVDGHQVLVRLLREQMDEDLALMIDLGLWLRILEIVSTIVAETPDVDTRVLCIGSPAILQDLRDDFSRISATRREDALIKRIGDTIEEVSATWKNMEQTPPSKDKVARTNVKLKELLQAIMQK